MERKMIKWIYFAMLLFLTVSCDNLSFKKGLCEEINPNNVAKLRHDYNVCSIKRRNHYYMIYNPEGNIKIILSLKNDRFYYKNYYSISDSVEINAIVDVLRIIDKYKVYELYILGTYHYYIFHKGDMMVNGATKYVSEHPNGIKIKDDWYYYEKESQ